MTYKYHRTAMTPNVTPSRLPSPATRVGATAFDVAVTTAPKVVLVGTTKAGVEVILEGRIVSVIVLITVDKSKLKAITSVVILGAAVNEIGSVTDAVEEPREKSVLVIVAVTCGTPVSPNPALAARLLRVTADLEDHTGEISEKVESVGRGWRWATNDD
jgi:hypothetical protein